MLKNYQKQSLKILDDFCNSLHVESIAQSFKGITNKQYLEIDNFDNPYVCLRVPTGGGKTLIAGIDLLSRECKIGYIITVDALKEGCFCPFAYILSVVSNMESKTAIEQLIGRVLRMPYIEEKMTKELGYSFVYVKSENFKDIASSIGDTLVKSGFEDFEAKISINNSNDTHEYVGELGGLWGEDIFEHRQIKVESINLDKLSSALIEPYVSYNIKTKNLTIVKIPSPSKRPAFIKSIQKIVPLEKYEKVVAIVKELESLNSDKLGFIEDIELPKLLIKEDIETKEILKKTILANKTLEKLSGVVKIIPNSNILINSLALQEAKDSSEIENIITTHEELYKANLDIRNITRETKEVQNYKNALLKGHDLVKENKLLLKKYILIIQEELEQNDAGMRKQSGTNLANTRAGEAIFTPPQEFDKIEELLNI